MQSSKPSNSFGNPTNPELKLGYLQRHVGKRLYPWHDWGDDWRLLKGVTGRFEVRGGVTLDVPRDRRECPLPSGHYLRDPIPAFLEEWVRFLFEGQTYFGKRDAAELPTDICPLDNRQGSYSSWQRYAAPKRISSEVIRLVEHVCTDMRRVGENWHDAVPDRSQLDAYRHWNEKGERVDKLRRFCVPRHPLEYVAHVADGKPPKSWHINRHWHTTYPIAFDDMRREKFTARGHDYFALLYGKFGLPPKPYPEAQPTKCRAPKRKDDRKSNIYADCLYLARQARNTRKEKHDEDCKTEEPLRRKAA